MNYYSRHDPVQEARDRRSHAWARWRRSVGLSDVDLVARLLDVSVRSIQRYESAAQAPKWYQAALYGLLETFPDRTTARKGRPRKVKLNKWGNAVHPEPACPYRTWDPKRYTQEGRPR